MTDNVRFDQHLAGTARWTAAVRAVESRRPDRLFDDPWAEALAGAEGHDWLTQRAGTAGVQLIVIRDRFFDDYLSRAVTGGIRQVVLVAAGLDTRAFRLAWPSGTTLFELDRAPLLRHKAEVLAARGAQPACERVDVGMDLAEPWPPALTGAGFDPDAPSCWLVEGLLFYLTDDDVRRLLGRISGLACAGSQLAFDTVNRVTLTHPLTRPWLQMQADLGAPWRSGMDDPAVPLKEMGWSCTVAQVGERSASYGRWPYPVLPRGLPGTPQNWLVTATKR